jgi:hypothetical protein
MAHEDEGGGWRVGGGGGGRVGGRADAIFFLGCEVLTFSLETVWTVM